jgi:acyl-coenzyme A synthetase/AMP-(fatty) acid ligase
MTTALSSALAADTDHIACFAPNGAEHRWQELVAAAARVHARLVPSDGRRWVLHLEDAFEFAAALLGCWAAGKTPVLAPAPMLGGGAAPLAFDGVIESSGAATNARERVVWQRLPATSEKIGKIPAAAPLVLYTSGSTGKPKEVVRHVHNVEAELAVLESLWGGELGAARIFSTVSHRHVYGMLFAVLWPLLNRRPFATFRLQYPEQLAGGAGQALVSSPALLKRIGHLTRGAGSWRTVVSSGGLLPAEAAADATRVLGSCPIEVLGSTETSGVAWRRQTSVGSTSFAALPKVETRASADDLLEARSPFSGQRSWLTMGDTVRFTAPGRFELLGRGDHLAKIEDKRVSLAEIERCLAESPWIADVAAVALDDGARQYVGAIVQVNAAGAAELQRRGRRSFNEALRAALRRRIEPIALPRKFRYVEAVPVDAQGKRQHAVLKELFERRR